jgi:peptide deformylase
MIKITQDHSILRQKSTPVESVKEAKEIIAKLEEVLSRTDNGLGLAAVQIGIPKQVGVIDWQGKKFYLINPEVIEAEGETIFVNEGCLSFPNTYLDTKRYKDFTIKNQVIEEDEFIEETHYFYYSPDASEPGNNGLQAIAVQHEIDHFNGKLIIDHRITRTPIVAQRKVGRNDPCPCGSGKKYKKCCMT